MVVALLLHKYMVKSSMEVVSALFRTGIFLLTSDKSTMPPESPPTSSRKRANQISLTVGASLAATVVQRHVLEDGLEEDEEWENSLVLLPDLPKRFSYEDLKSATQNFDVNKRLGGGGFGSVFEGTLLDGTRVAVKRLDRLGQGRKEFLAEVQTMGKYTISTW
ncbi:hypothetical protein RJ640_000330 [Escallonia rubra]|uniref:Protein kinase domain-containing protein n=1 Tax=Escallonia rubra TaxID=112253 RepID=A0AA88RNF4_9ASTE|nr:hypothetical protein RJ640_000330 [Escallonia rubra]